jgi:hypothetical protein
LVIMLEQEAVSEERDVVPLWSLTACHTARVVGIAAFWWCHRSIAQVEVDLRGRCSSASQVSGIGNAASITVDVGALA